MTGIFHYSCNSTKNHNLQVHNRNTSRYGSKSLRILGTHTWDSFPEDIKSTTSIYKLKEFVKGWYRGKLTRVRSSSLYTYLLKSF